MARARPSFHYVMSSSRVHPWVRRVAWDWWWYVWLNLRYWSWYPVVNPRLTYLLALLVCMGTIAARRVR